MFQRKEVSGKGGDNESELKVSNRRPKRKFLPGGMR